MADEVRDDEKQEGYEEPSLTDLEEVAGGLSGGCGTGGSGCATSGSADLEPEAGAAT